MFGEKINCGINFIDQSLGGFQRGKLYSLSSKETSVGKTALATAIATSLVKDGRRVMFFTNESYAVDVAAKIASCGTQIPFTTIAEGKCTEDQKSSLLNFLEVLKDRCLVADKESRSVRTIYEYVVNFSKHEKIDFVILDRLSGVEFDFEHLNIFKSTSTKGKIAESLKLLASESSVPILVLNQPIFDPDEGALEYSEHTALEELSDGGIYIEKRNTDDDGLLQIHFSSPPTKAVSINITADFTTGNFMKTKTLKNL